MSIAEKSIIIAENVPKVYQAGYEKGKADGGGGENPFYYATSLNTVFMGASFPENHEIIIKMRKAPTTAHQVFYNATNYKFVKWIVEDNSTPINFRNSHRVTSSKPCLEVADFTEFNPKPTSIAEMFRSQNKLKSILGVFDLTNCTETTNFVRECSALEDVEFVPNTIKISISFDYCPLLTAKSIQSIIDGLATVETAQTLTLHSNVKILQSQVDSANEKGWTVAGGTVVSEEEYYG